MVSAVVAAASAPPSARIRRPEPAPARAPARPLRISITGRLAEHAHTVVEAVSGYAGLAIVLEQCPGQPQVLATLWLGEGYDAQRECDNRAQFLGAGDLVTVHGEGLRMRFHAGAMALSVSIVTGVELVTS